MKTKNNEPSKELKALLRYEPMKGKFYWVECDENCNRNTVDPIGYKAKRYPQIRFQGKRYQMHRVAYWYHTGEWPEIVDHINRDTTDYRPENLRAATHASNRINCSGNQGIETRTLKDGDISYSVRIQLGGNTYQIGTYHEQSTAKYAAWKMRDLLFPGFAPIDIFTEEDIKDLKGLIAAYREVSAVS